MAAHREHLLRLEPSLALDAPKLLIVSVVAHLLCTPLRVSAHGNTRITQQPIICASFVASVVFFQKLFIQSYSSFRPGSTRSLLLRLRTRIRET